MSDRLGAGSFCGHRCRRPRLILQAALWPRAGRRAFAREIKRIVESSERIGYNTRLDFIFDRALRGPVMT